VAHKIINKFKEPKFTEFSRKDLVIDIKNGVLYYKSNIGVHRISSGLATNTFGSGDITNITNFNVGIPATFKGDGIRIGDSSIDGTLTIGGNTIIGNNTTITGSIIIQESASFGNIIPHPGLDVELGSLVITASNSQIQISSSTTNSSPSSLFLNGDLIKITTGSFSQTVRIDNIEGPVSMSIDPSWLGNLISTGSHNFFTDPDLLVVEASDGKRELVLDRRGNLDINGSLTADLTSQSNSNLVYYNNTTGELTQESSANFISSSFALNSGAITGSSTLPISILSASLAASITNVSTGATFKSTGKRIGDSVITGSLIVTDTITAQEFHTEFISSSIIFQSGSTKFGNSPDDIHKFTGTLSISGSGVGHISASGNISASGHVSASKLISAGPIHGFLDDSTNLNLVYFNNDTKELTQDSTASFIARALEINAAAISGTLSITSLDALGITLLSSSAQIADAISGSYLGELSSSLYLQNVANTISGSYLGELSSSLYLENTSNVISGSWQGELSSSVYLQQVASAISGSWQSQGLISSSNQITSSYSTLSAAGISGSFLLNTTDTLTGELFVTNHITASGNISASGLISASTAVFPNLPNISQDSAVYFNRLTGQLSFASSPNSIGISGSWQGELSSSVYLQQVANVITGSFTDLSASIAADITNNAANTFKTTGQRSGDSTITGSLHITSHLTASGNISASGHVSASKLISAGPIHGFLDDSTNLNLVYFNNTTKELTQDSTASFIARALEINADAISGALSITSLDALGITLLSSSAQIADAISGSYLGELSSSLYLQNVSDTITGSFTDLSASIAETITSNAANTFKTTGQRSGDSVITGSLLLTHLTASGNISASGYISASKLISAGPIHGFLDDSTNLNLVYFNNTTKELSQNTTASFIARALEINAAAISGALSITSLDALGITLLSSSAQIANDITGSWQGELSSSVYLQQVSDAISGSYLGELSSSVYLQNVSNIISGSWQSQGLISSSNQITSSYSTLSAAGISGSFLLNTTDTLTGELFVTNHITASGNISASGHVSASEFLIPINGSFSGVDNKIQMPANDQIDLVPGGTVAVRIKSTKIILNKDTSVNGHITASGNISASGHVSASKLISAGPIHGFLDNTTNLNLVYFNNDTKELTQDSTASFIAKALELNAAAISGALSITSLDALGITLLSSSAQIADAISGSYLGELSSSLYLQQVANTISGSYLGELSSSLYLENTSNVISGSWQGELSSSVYLQNVSDTITGSFTDLSASIAADITNNAANTFKTTGQRSGDSTITGSLHVTGNISGSIISASGNIFGSNISASRTIFGKKLKGPDSTDGMIVEALNGIQIVSTAAYTINPSNLTIKDGDLTVESHITASGNISASGYISSSGLVVTGKSRFEDDITLIQNKKIIFDSEDTFIKSTTAGVEVLQIGADDDIVLMPDDDLVIKTETDEYARFFGTEKIFELSGSIRTTFGGHITASGNISSSGHISASNANLSSLTNLVTTSSLFYNESTGELYYGTAAAAFTAAGISGSLFAQTASIAKKLAKQLTLTGSGGDNQSGLLLSKPGVPTAVTEFPPSFDGLIAKQLELNIGSLKDHSSIINGQTEIGDYLIVIQSGSVEGKHTFRTNFSSIFDSVAGTNISWNEGEHEFQVNQPVATGTISASSFSSPSQGTHRATINGINNDVDLGLQTTDSPLFNDITASGDISASGRLLVHNNTGEGSIFFGEGGTSTVVINSPDLSYSKIALVVNGGLKVANGGHITASANITASGHIIGKDILGINTISSSKDVVGITGSFQYLRPESINIPVTGTITASSDGFSNYQTTLIANGDGAFNSEINVGDAIFIESASGFPSEILTVAEIVNDNTLLTTSGSVNLSGSFINLFLDPNLLTVVNSANVEKFVVDKSGDLYTSGSIHLRETKRISFDNESVSDQYITGTDNNISIYGDGRINLQNSIETRFQDNNGKTVTFISASGDILTSGSLSASKSIFFSSSLNNDQNLQTLVYDTSTGKIFNTHQVTPGGISGSFLLNTTDTLTGDLTVTGTLTAQEFHTEFTSASIIFSSGSSIFGDSADDTHIFSGSINVKDDGHITASGNISASGDILFKNAYATNQYRLKDSSGTSRNVLKRTTTNKLELGNTNFTEGLLLTGIVTASSHISASGDILFKNAYGDDEIYLKESNGTFRHVVRRKPSTNTLQLGNVNYEGILISGNVTASNNISASGILFAKVTDNDDESFKTVMYDTTTGQFFRTGSYGGEGGGGGGSADNLGNHTATEGLNMNGFSITASKDIEIQDSIIHDGDNDTKIAFSTDQIDFFAGGRKFISLIEGGTDEVVINEGSGDVDFRIESDDDTEVFFVNGGTDKIGIGTTTPNEKLTVDGGISASGNIAAAGVMASTQGFFHQGTILTNNTSLSAGTSIGIGSNNTTQPEISVTPGGNTGDILMANIGVGVDEMTGDAGLTFDSNALTGGTDTLSVAGDIIAFASDERLKENIIEISNPIEKIQQLRGVTYDWKDKALDLGFATARQYNEIGLIAQELEKIIPQAIARAPFDNEHNKKLYVLGDRIDGETEPYKTIKMDKVIPLLIEGIKDQQKQIDELKEMIIKLGNKN